MIFATQCLVSSICKAYAIYLETILSLNAIEQLSLKCHNHNKKHITIPICEGDEEKNAWAQNFLLKSSRVKVKVAQYCPTLCHPMDYTVHGILQARILKWVAFPFSRGSSQPRDRTQVSHIADIFFTSWATREAWVLRLNNYYHTVYSLKSPSFSTEIHRDFRTLYSKPSYLSFWHFCRGWVS